MSDNEDVEKARIAREARESVAGRPPSSGGAVLAALKRYLSTEQYRSEQRRARRRPGS